LKKILIGYIDNSVASGITKYLLNLLSKYDKEKTQIDLLYKGKDEEFEKRIKELGYNIHCINSLKRPLKQLIETINICKKNKYDVAYFNVSESYNCIGILAAKLCRVKKIIIHSHSSSAFGKNPVIRMHKRILNKVCKPLIYYCANTYYACSSNAAKWLFPHRIFKTQNYEIIYNTIDFEKFKFDQDVRNSVRKELDIENKFVLGFVGRFSREKNTLFLLDILKKLQMHKDAVLLTVGDGKEYCKFVNYAEKLGIKDRIISVGKSDTVEKYYQAMDALLLPSFFEGLPVVALEAQVSGVPCFISDRVDSQIVISNNTKLISIKNCEKWVEEIDKCNTRENILNENSNNYNLKVSKQHEKIIFEEPKQNEKAPLLLFYILVIHYLLNITSYFNGLNITIFASGLLIIPYIFHYVRNFKNVVREKINIIFLIWIADFIITNVFNKNYDMVSFIKETVWLLLMLIVVFGYKKNTDKKILKYDIEHIAIFFISMISIINLINLALLVFNVGTVVKTFFGEATILGMTKWNRFFGVYYDPNYAAITSVVGIILAYYFAIKSENPAKRLVFILSMIVQTIFVVFSQSRTGYISLGLGLGLTIILSFITTKQYIKLYRIKIVLTNITYIVISAIVIFAINKYCIITNQPRIQNSNVTNTIIANEVVENNNIKSSNNTTNGINNGNNEKTIIENDKNEEREKSGENQEISIFRRNDSPDISNRRFDIWKSGFDIFKTSPIFGVGIDNASQYAKENLPDTYIVNNGFKMFTRFHNVIVDTAVSQGAIGLIILAIMLIITIKHFIVYRREMFGSENAFLICTLLSGTLGIGVSALFLSEIFYVNNSCTFLFWLLIGYGYYLVQDKQGGRQKGE